MNYLFLLSGENESLAKEEILSLSNPKDYKKDNRILITNKKFDFDRLAFTHKIYNLIFSCKPNELEFYIKKTNFNRIYKKNFSVRAIRIPQKLKIKFLEEELADFIYHKIKNPKVDLKNAKTQFEFIFTKDRVYCCKLIKKIEKKGFLERRPHLRPEFHPTSMTPRFAKSLVNLSEVKPNQVLLDPFCGVGGILIEAGLLKCKIIGYDLNKELIEKAKTNLKHYKIKNFNLEHRNALSINKKIDVIVTDIPYGRHSSLYDTKMKYLVEKFLEKSYSCLKKNGKICIVVPDYLKFKIKRFKIKKEIKNRVHSTLVRRIIVLEK